MNISMMMMQILLFFLLFFSIRLGFGANHQPPRRPNIYRWLAQNSYICDPTLLNHRSPRFLSAPESHRLRCSCGDPLITKSACGRRSRRAKPVCFRLPDTCIQEYTMIFASGGNRMSKPLHPPTKRPSSKFSPHRKTETAVIRRPHRMPKIVSTIPVTTVLRVTKTKPRP